MENQCQHYASAYTKWNNSRLETNFPFTYHLPFKQRSLRVSLQRKRKTNWMKGTTLILSVRNTKPKKSLAVHIHPYKLCQRTISSNRAHNEPESIPLPTVVEAPTATWVTTDGCCRRNCNILYAGRITHFKFFPRYSCYKAQLLLHFRLHGSGLHNNPQKHPILNTL